MTDQTDLQQSGNTDATPSSALMWFGIICLLVTVLLITLLDTQTSWVDGQPLSRQPALSSIVSLYGMAFFGLCWLGLNWRRHRGWYRQNPLGEMAKWAVSLEYAAWFMCYVWLVPITGYLPTTLAFCILLALRCGYRSRQALLNAALVALFIVVLFKSFLAVKIPGALVYEWLPSGLRNFMIINF